MWKKLIVFGNNEYIDSLLRENVIRKNIRAPDFAVDSAQINDAFSVSNDILEYNAKVKLHDTSIGTNIPSNRSTLWNYDIDINFILNKNKEDIQELIDKIKTKENEIVQTEIAYKNNSIYNPNYQPIFLKNLDVEEKKELADIINDKIKNIKFAISRSQISKCENESIKKIYQFSSPKNSLSKKEIISDNNNSKITNNPKKKFISHNKNNMSIKFSLTSQGFGKKNIYNNRNLDKEEMIGKMNTMGYTKDNFNNKLNLQENKNNAINNSKSQKYKIDNNYFNPIKTTLGNDNKKWGKRYHDQRIQKCLSQFEEKLNELARPFALLYHNKKIKKNTFPKINYNIFTNYNNNEK